MESYPQAGPDGLPVASYDVTVKRVSEREKFVCEGVPPEEVRIAKDCRTIDDTRFIEHRRARTRSDLISEGWPKAEVAKLPKFGESSDDEQSRHAYDDSQDTDERPDASQEEVEVSEAYIRIDYDGDGKSEYRRVVKSGMYVHENEVTDDHCFAVFSPVLMPYKVIGLSLFDLVEDLQRIKTALTRQVLDNVYLANTPRYSVVEGQVNLDDLLNPVLGGLVRRKAGAQADAVVPLTVPFMADAGLGLIQFVDQVRDMRTGVTETNSALNAESLARGAVGSEGVQSLMQAGAQRQKLIARVLAETGLKRMYLLMLKLVTQYQDRPAQVKVNGRWLEIDPREWATTYRVSVKVGLGAHDKAQEIANLGLLGQAQQQAFQVGLVKPQNVHYLLSRLCVAMGYKESDKFFSEPNPNPQPQPPPIELQLEQMKQAGAQQLAQTKGQVDIQVEQMRQQAQDAQMQRELSMQAERDQQKMQNEMALARYQAELDMEAKIQTARIAHATAIETARINAQASVVSASMQPDVDNDERFA